MVIRPLDEEDDESEPANEEEREARRRQLWLKTLGVSPPEWEDEALAPPVDRELVRAFVRRTLTESQDRHVDDLISRYRSWSRACTDAAVEAYREDQSRKN